MTNPSMTTAEVCSNQQLLQFIQIAIERSAKVLKQLEDDQVSMKWNLGSAITHLKMAEADLSDKMGFAWHANDCREAAHARMDAYLASTHESFVSAVERSSTIDTSGVLAGPRQ